jgi:hypothetical protein
MVSRGNGRTWPIAGLIALAIAALLLAGAATASAAPAAVTIDSLSPTLEGEDDGTAKVAVGLTNLTDGKVGLTASAEGSPAGCELTPDKTELPGEQLTTVTISTAAACKAADGIAIKVVLTPGSGAAQTFVVKPVAEPAPEEPDWDQLWAFAAALLGSLLLVTIIYFWWHHNNGNAQGGLRRPLSSLDAAWSFNDNWVTNVTAAGALLTGIFGTTTVAVAFLGPEAESSLALATVGAAVAAAFVAAGPIVLLATKSYKPTGTPPVRGNSYTAFGLLLGSTLVLTSAFGQLWVVRATAGDFDLGGLEDWLWIPFGAAALLLLVYACRTLLDLLTRGSETPPTAPPEPTVMDAAELIAKALRAKKDVDTAKVNDALRAVEEKFPEPSAAVPAAYEQAPRSALL